MLQFFRKALSSWVVLALLGLLLVAFVITGVGDPFGGGGGPAPGSLVKVGDTNITEPQFRQRFDQMLQQARQQNPTATAEQAARAGLVEQLVDQMSSLAALDQFAARQGLAYSDSAIDREIAAIPAFQIAGRFDQGTYEQALASQRLSDRELRQGLRGEALRRQLLVPIAYGAQSPRALGEPYASLLLEQRRGLIATIPTASVKGIAPATDAQLNAFYRANIGRYTLPERRAFRYALIRKDDVVNRVEISDADVQRYFDDHKDVYGGTEQRELSQVVVQDQAVAQRIAARAKSGDPFASVATQLAGYAPGDVKLGLLDQAKLAETTNADVARAVFAAPTGGVVGPIKSDFGWHVVRVDGVTPGKSRSLAQVRDEITKTLRTERAEDLLSDQVAEIEDALGDGQSFADVAKTYNLTPVQVPLATRDGRTADRSGVQLPPQVTPLVAHAFEAQAGEEPTVQELGKDSFAVLEVTDIVEPTPVPLAQVRNVVATEWLRDQRMTRAKATADAIVAEVKGGTSLAQALSKRGLPAAQPFTGRRVDISRGGQVPPPLALMFSMPKGSVRPLPGPNGLGWYVVTTDEVAPGNPATAPGILEATQAEMARNAGEELLAQFAHAVRSRVGVQRDDEAIEALKRRYLGQAPATDE